MSTTSAPESQAVALTTTSIPLTRLIRVELRKMVNTRSGLWLLIAIAAITLLAEILILLNAHGSELTFHVFMAGTGAPQGFLLPVLGILLVTSEWSQRTAMVTFSLEPKRLKVLAAKVIAALVIGLAAIVLAMILAALFALIAGGSDPWRDFSLSLIGREVLLQAIGLMEGIGFGLAFLASAPAIVLYYILPLALGIITHLWTGPAKVWPWINLEQAQVPLREVGAMTGTDWAHLLVAVALWVLLPLAIGVWRWQRSEIK